MKIKTSTLTPILILVALIIAGMVIPIGNTNDIYLSVMVEKPIAPFLIGDSPAKIIDVTGYATKHTLIESIYLADIGAISSGSLKLTAETGKKLSLKPAGTLIKGTSGTYQITLRDVPPTQTNVTVKLYENNAVVDTKTVIVTEVK